MSYMQSDTATTVKIATTILSRLAGGPSYRTQIINFPALQSIDALHIYEVLDTLVDQGLIAQVGLSSDPKYKMV